MAPPTLDLFILTFNCAKDFISPFIFASHLYGALTQNATGLPDLVVLSLQEVAPLPYAFVGSYFLNPYYARFGEALNLASVRVLASTDGNDESPSLSAPQSAAGPQGGTPPYALVRAKNVGMTAILLYARDPASIRKIEEAECGFGAADMGNKGAVGLRVTFSGRQMDSGRADDPPKTTELTFVAAHLAAMEWNLKKRNSNWRSIVSGLTFANPRTVLPVGAFPANHTLTPTPGRSAAGNIAPLPPHLLPTGDSPDPSEEEPEPEPEPEDDSDSNSDSRPLLHPGASSESEQPLSAAALASLRAVSIYKPTAYLFVAGDLNYRIGATTPPPLARFPSFDPTSQDYYPSFLPRDQLTMERLAGRTLHGLSEAQVTFGPTYKFDVLPTVEGAANEREVRGDNDGVGVVPWRFAPHRWPGWCDRVLYLDVPPWVSSSTAAAYGGNSSSSSSSSSDEGEGRGGQKQKKKKKQKVAVEVKAYDALPVVATSDHRAVFFRANVPILGPEEMRFPEGADPAAADAAALEEGGEGQGYIAKDPRVMLPVPVDVHAWERRAAARRKEVLVGMSALLWSTREGALVLATALALGVGSWWLWRVQ